MLHTPYSYQSSFLQAGWRSRRTGDQGKVQTHREAIFLSGQLHPQQNCPAQWRSHSTDPFASAPRSYGAWPRHSLHSCHKDKRYQDHDHHSVDADYVAYLRHEAHTVGAYINEHIFIRPCWWTMIFLNMWKCFLLILWRKFVTLSVFPSVCAKLFITTDSNYDLIDTCSQYVIDNQYHTL